MPVSNGQKANAALFNTTFLDKTQDDTTIGKLGLNAPASGPAITNTQQEINDLKDEFNPSTGHKHDGVDSKKVLATDLDSTGGSNGQVLKSDGAGNSSWQNPVIRTVTGTEGAPISITAASGITRSATISDEVIFIESDGGQVNLTAIPQISNGAFVGQFMTLVGKSDTNTLLLEDGDGLSLNGTIELFDNTILELMWSGTLWLERSRKE